ncbi:alpha/beta fold hydrolase [Nakamurella aerolata]|uniref:Alpha/beta hydrolase n=1 Tax=Nakamurella aerolata TaxID=1656892 RepID=A0A849AAY3_9ACTN|nr:alpha/beta hydrolase [Nakamurella aerolata]NNG35640.1 alpha/beta hydrolase [Nakamurella aerolata]
MTTPPKTPSSHTLSLPGVELVYDVRGPLPTEDGRPPLLLIGSPMDATGFTTLAGLMADRTVVTYDPRGLGRSERSDAGTEQDPEVQADDLHALIAELGAGPVDVFASSGGAVTGLALVARHPGDVGTLVAHEPPSIPMLPDAAAARRAWDAVRNAYLDKGFNHGMAAFMALTGWRGEFTDEYFAQPPADPAAFGMPQDEPAGSDTRDDPLLSDRSAPISAYSPDIAALTAAPTRVVIAVGEESADMFTDRTSRAIARALGQQVAVFPSHHGGFMGGEFGYPGQPEAFAVRLREVLAG